MSETGLDTFDRTVQLTNEWLRDIMEGLGTDDRHLAYSALRATLHALRDRLPTDEVAHLGAQLPMLVSGIYYDGWKPATNPTRQSRQEFVDRVASIVNDRDPEQIIRTVFSVLQNRVTVGEMRDIQGALPEDMAVYWRAA